MSASHRCRTSGTARRSASCISAVSFLLLLSSPAFAATIPWAAAVSGNWSDGARWVGGVAPGPGDDAVIDVAGSYTVTLTAPVSVQSLTLGGASGSQLLGTTGPSLTLASASSIGPNGILSLTSASVGGTGSLANAGSILLRGGAAISIPVDNSGTIRARSNPNTIGGALTTQPGSTLRVDSDGVNANAVLVVSNGFTNHGLIELSETAPLGQVHRLDVTSGTLVNDTDGVIAAAAGGYALAPKFLGAQLDNRGVVNVSSSGGLSVDKGSADHLNPGTINVTAGNLAIGQSGSTPTFGHSGTFAISASRAVTITGGAMTFDPGTTTGTGRLILVGVNVTNSLTHTATSAPLVLGGSGNVVASMDLQGGTVLARSNANTITMLSKAAAGTLRVDSDGVNANAVLVVSNGFTNHGLIELSETAPLGQVHRLDVTSGTLINAVDGLIAAAVGGYGPAPKAIAARVENHGVMDVDSPLSMLVGPFINHFDGLIRGTGGNLNVTAVAFTQNGTLSPGASPGLLTVTQNVTSMPTSVLDIEIGGHTLGTQYDRLAVAQSFAAGGTLNLSLINGFVPVLGDSFAIVTAPTRTGTFATVTGRTITPGVLDWVVKYYSNHIAIIAGTPPPNNGPSAGDDAIALDEDTTLDFTVLGNDSDPDADPVHVVPVLAQLPNHGFVSFLGGDSIRYVPAAHYYGGDLFRYVIHDGRGAQDTATVTVTVRPINDPPAFVAPTPLDSSVIVTPPGSNVTFFIAATDPHDPAGIVTLTSTTLPAGASMTPPLPTAAHSPMSQFQWMPTTLQLGDHCMDFYATDDSLSQVVRHICIRVEAATSALLAQFSAAGGPDAIELSWTFGDPARVTAARVERSASPAGPWSEPAGTDRWREGDTQRLRDRGVTAGIRYYYRLVATATDGSSRTFGPIEATAGEAIERFSITRVSPNPATGPAKVDFALPIPGRVELSVLDVQGRVIATLVDGWLPAGRHQAAWSGGSSGGPAPAGIYFVRLSTPGGAFTKRVTLAR